MSGSRVSHRNRIVFFYIIIDLNPFNLSDKKDVGKGSQKGKGADKDEGGRKASPFARKPMTIGTITEARLPTKLNTPPVSPIKCLGAKDDTSTHVMEARPFPKRQAS